MNRELLKYKELFSIVILIGISVLLRLTSLGYSHFQGDEIRALTPPNVPLIDFLLSQKKGPLQFIVTFLSGRMTNGFDELLTRLPFAVCGILAVLVLYFLVKKLYGSLAAFIAAFLFSVNGFFVAFSRIVQYQVLTYLFFLLALLAFSVFATDKKIKYLYMGAVLLALSVLAHYDGMFASLPAVYLVLKPGLSYVKKNILHYTLSFLIFVFLLALFYVPFVLDPSFSSGTASYLLGRLSGEDGGNKVTNTGVTYRIYNPILSYEFISVFLIIGTVLGRSKLLPIYLWIIPPLLILNFVSAIPGTHIYNYVLPAIVIASYGVASLLRKFKAGVLKPVLYGSLFTVLIFFFYQSYQIFVDHSTEYPWFEKKILGKEIKLPDKKYHLSLFGFPYNRNLKEIDSFVRLNSEIDGIISNEGSKIVRYYVNPLPTLTPKYQAYIYIYGAQSMLKSKSSKVQGKEPALEISRGEQSIAEVYLIPK